MTSVEASRVIKCPRCGANLSALLKCELRDAETYQSPVVHAKVWEKFPPELAQKLRIVDVTKDDVLLKGKTWLGSSDFGRILGIVKELGGDWVSQGKDSHFRISREAFA